MWCDSPIPADFLRAPILGFPPPGLEVEPPNHGFYWLWGSDNNASQWSQKLLACIHLGSRTHARPSRIHKHTYRKEESKRDRERSRETFKKNISSLKHPDWAQPAGWKRCPCRLISCLDINSVKLCKQSANSSTPAQRPDQLPGTLLMSAAAINVFKTSKHSCKWFS